MTRWSCSLGRLRATPRVSEGLKEAPFDTSSLVHRVRSRLCSVGPALVQVVRQLPSEPGVYRFRDGEGEVLYVGQAAQLRSRVASHWSDLRDRQHLQPMVAAVASIEALVCGSRHEAAWLERNVLEGAALPPWNRTPGGQETPAVIVLDRRRPRPRLVVAHLPHEPIAGGSIFGPFLGGLQVRRAVAGLHRHTPWPTPAPGSAAPNERWPPSAALPSVTGHPRRCTDGGSRPRPGWWPNSASRRCGSGLSLRRRSSSRPASTANCADWNGSAACNASAP